MWHASCSGEFWKNNLIMILVTKRTWWNGGSSSLNQNRTPQPSWLASVRVPRDYYLQCKPKWNPIGGIARRGEVECTLWHKISTYEKWFWNNDLGKNCESPCIIPWKSLSLLEFLRLLNAWKYKKIQVSRNYFRNSFVSEGNPSKLNGGKTAQN